MGEAYLSALMRHNTKEQLAKSYADMEVVLERRARALADAHNVTARVNQDWCKTKQLTRIMALWMQCPTSPRLMLMFWGRHSRCRDFAKEHGLAPTQWHWVSDLNQFRGRVGPVCDPASPYRLIVLECSDWKPSHEEAAYVRAIGFPV